MKDWKLIFNTNNYHYILINESIKEKYLNFFFKHKENIQNIDSFFFLMPTEEEIKYDTVGKNIKKYALLLKEFLENDKKKTLFMEEDIFKSIVKEEKRINFFRLISQKNKNIVFFFYSDIGNYAKNPHYTFIEMSESDLENNYNLLEDFINIKQTFNELNSTLPITQ